jgi:hypothetical protein
MATPAQDLLERIRAHFAQYPRPHDYINRHHCGECEEHYQELLEVPVEKIAYAHVENAGWDPTCFLSSEGFRYYFPGLARIADQHREDWLGVLVSRLESWQVESFSAADRALVRELLEYWFLCEDLSEWDHTDIGRVLEYYR